MITNEINLFGLARVKDECKTQKDLSSSWSSHHDTGRGPEHISRYLCNSKFVSKFIRKHTMKLTLITFKMNVSGLAVSCNNMQTIVYLTSFQLLGIKCQEILSCHDHDILTLHQPMRLQHFERGNENEFNHQIKLPWPPNYTFTRDNPHTCYTCQTAS